MAPGSGISQVPLSTVFKHSLALHYVISVDLSRYTFFCIRFHFINYFNLPNLYLCLNLCHLFVTSRWRVNHFSVSVIVLYNTPWSSVFNRHHHGDKYTTICAILPNRCYHPLLCACSKCFKKQVQAPRKKETETGNKKQEKVRGGGWYVCHATTREHTRREKEHSSYK